MRQGMFKLDEKLLPQQIARGPIGAPPPDWIRLVAAAAEPMVERLGPAALGKSATQHLSERQIATWREVLGSDELLNRRLRASRLAAARVLRAKSRREREMPAWATALVEILDSAPATSRNTPEAGEVPFQHALTGFSSFARRRLSDEPASAALSSTAFASMERDLLSHLSFLANLTLGREFYFFRLDRVPLSAFESFWTRRERGAEIYFTFVEHLRDGGWRDLLGRFPVLARLLAQSTLLWVEAAGNLCRRFRKDFNLLRRYFSWNATAWQGAIAAVAPDLSDRHFGGQTVCECILSTGERVIYKPRTVAGESTFYGFVEWLNGHGFPLGLNAMRALDRESHGWMEAAAAAPCGAPEQVERFYYRFGAMLAVLHALGATDMHCENVIASGERPIMADLEMLLCSSPAEARGRRPSVIDTGILSRGRGVDASAVGAESVLDSGLQFPKWKFPNSDRMMLTQSSCPEKTHHRVRVEDEFPPIVEHMRAFRSGFRRAYVFLLNIRGKILADRVLLRSFNSQPWRVLVRDSATYASIHLQLLHPEYLEDGIGRSIEIEWLARPVCATVRPSMSRLLVYEHERRQMEMLDIPHFDTTAWRRFGHPKGSAEMLIQGGSRDSKALRKRLNSFSPEDCRYQLRVINRSIRARYQATSPK
jgi:type 2 lantibiotic biosynthesis protein LanM